MKIQKIIIEKRIEMDIKNIMEKRQKLNENLGNPLI